MDGPWSASLGHALPFVPPLHEHRAAPGRIEVGDQYAVQLDSRLRRNTDERNLPVGDAPVFVNTEDLVLEAYLLLCSRRFRHVPEDGRSAAHGFLEGGHLVSGILREKPREGLAILGFPGMAVCVEPGPERVAAHEVAYHLVSSRSAGFACFLSYAI